MHSNDRSFPCRLTHSDGESLLGCWATPGGARTGGSGSFIEECLRQDVLTRSFAMIFSGGSEGLQLHEGRDKHCRTEEADEIDWS